VISIPTLRKTRGVLLGLFMALLVGLALRCIDLNRRPMHNDEAANAIRFRTLWEEGSYRYDPNEHHGPALFYGTLIWEKLTGAGDFAQFSEARLRSVAALFGLGLILLLPLVADGLGRGATVCAGLLVAVSPAMVYYSRDYIHETALVCFTFLALAGGWRYFRSPKAGWAALTGAAIGLMQSTKETFVLPLAAAGTALLLNAGWTRLEATTPGRPFRLRPAHAGIALGAWVLVAVVLFSSFFTNARGPLDALRTYSPWLQRAAGASPHIHPWTFYLGRLAFFHVRNGPVWSEALILALALAGICTAVARKVPRDAHAGFLRFIALYTLVLTAMYSLIPYKTPWCLLGFWNGMILMAAVGAVAILRGVRGRRLRLATACGLLLGAGQLAYQAWQSSVPHGADRANPYAYAETSPDIRNLTEALQKLAQADPEGRHLLVKVMAPGADYWPLPWYLRAFDRVGWWSETSPDPFAPVMMVSSKLDAGLDRNGTHVAAGLFEVRPDAFFELYVETNLWRAFLQRAPAHDQ
jgi:uncharacterized protein (TIGR03663 family)